MDNDINDFAEELHNQWRKDIKFMLGHSKKQCDGSLLFAFDKANSEHHRLLNSTANLIYLGGMIFYRIDKSIVIHFEELSNIEFDNLPEIKKKFARNAAKSFIKKKGIKFKQFDYSSKKIINIKLSSSNNCNIDYSLSPMSYL